MYKHTTAYHLFIALLLLVSVLAAYGLDQILQQTGIASWSWLIGLPSVLAIFAFLNWTVYAKFLWHFPFMRWVGIVGVPDLRGRWEGSLQSSYDRQQHSCVFEIEQSAYQIRVWGYFERSFSNPIIAGFTTIHHRQYLYFTYDNETGALSGDGMHPHKGTARLEFYNDELRGSYFNDRGNHGEIVMHRTDSKLLHCFRGN